MIQIKKFLNINFIIGYIKALFYKFFNNKINMNGFKYFIGKKSRLISKNGNISMNDKVWISSYCKIEADGGKIELGYNTFINDKTYIVSKERIYIGEDCLIGPGVCIYDHDHIYSDKNVAICKQGFKSQSIYIENDVWIGANSVITKGVRIGKHSIIGANSVITKDVQPYSLVGCNPAKLIRNINEIDKKY